MTRRRLWSTVAVVVLAGLVLSATALWLALPRLARWAVVWQVGARAVGFVGHPGLKVAMVEDLVMEFEESPPSVDSGLRALRNAQRALEDALVPIMTGLVQLTGWMDERRSAG